jgi:16S rRNA C967 or C1407 C5-methylase (RsmB/RsmF family)
VAPFPGTIAGARRGAASHPADRRNAGKPGGSLVYATCSLLREENEQQVARFDRSGFEIDRTAAWLPDEGPSSSFFLAKWVLRARD